jgi:hypothetical protein
MKRFFSLVSVLIFLIIMTPSQSSAQGRDGTSPAQQQAQRDAAAKQQREAAAAAKRDRDAATQRQREAAASAQREREANARRDREAAASAQREREADARREREARDQRDREASAQRDREASAQRDREASAQRDREASAQRDREASAQRERETNAQEEREAAAQRQKEQNAQEESEAQARRDQAAAHAERNRVEPPKEKPVPAKIPPALQPLELMPEPSNVEPGASFAEIEAASIAKAPASRGGGIDLFPEAADPDKIQMLRPTRPGFDIDPTSFDTVLTAYNPASGTGPGGGGNGQGYGGNGNYYVDNYVYTETYYWDEIYYSNPYVYYDYGYCVYNDFYGSGYYADYYYAPSYSIYNCLDDNLNLLKLMNQHPQWESSLFLEQYGLALWMLCHATTCLSGNWSRGYYIHEWEFYDRLYQRYANLLPSDRKLFLEYESYYRVKGLLIDEVLPEIPVDPKGLSQYMDTAFSDKWGGRAYYDIILAFNPDDVRIGMSEGVGFNAALASNKSYLNLHHVFSSYGSSQFQQKLLEQAATDLAKGESMQATDPDHAGYYASNAAYMIRGVLLMDPTHPAAHNSLAKANELVTALDYIEPEE